MLIDIPAFSITAIDVVLAAMYLIIGGLLAFIGTVASWGGGRPPGIGERVLLALLWPLFMAPLIVGLIFQWLWSLRSEQ